MKLLLIVVLSALALARASDVFAQGKPIGAEEGCDTACRAARNNPKPNFVSPEVSPDGKVTVRVYAPKADSIGIGGLEPLNDNGESEVAAQKKARTESGRMSRPRDPLVLLRISSGLMGSTRSTQAIWTWFMDGYAFRILLKSEMARILPATIRTFRMVPWVRSSTAHPALISTGVCASTRRLDMDRNKRCFPCCFFFTAVAGRKTHGANSAAPTSSLTS